jgi:serine protease Do
MRFVKFTALALGLVVAAACTTNPIWARSSPSPTAVISSPTAGFPIPAASPAPPVTAAFDAARIVKVLGPAVAEILVTQAAGTRGIGSGFVIAHEQGASFIVTNNHVLTGATRIVVLMPDGRHFLAKMQGSDPIQDLAVVRVEDASLPLARFGDSTKLVVGQQVVAIGSPHGNQGSVTTGIISALHRTLTATTRPGTPSEDLPDVLQTDAAINPGNSGGPLADADGNVIGVNTAMDASGQGIGYAIPSLIAKRIVQDLIAGRKPGHPYMGICYQSEEAALASGKEVPGYGVLVTSALPGSPAAKAGLKSGDVIEKVDGVELNNGQTLGGAIQARGPGDTVHLTVLRSGATTTLPLTLADRASAPTASCAATP